MSYNIHFHQPLLTILQEGGYSMRTIARLTSCPAGMMCIAIIIAAAALFFARVQAFAQPVPAHRVVIKSQKQDAGVIDFKVIRWNDITKVLPPFDELPTQGLPVSGFYYELQAADGTVLYRRIIQNPIPIVAERTEQTTGAAALNQAPLRLERDVIIPRERVFSLLIPRAGPGDQLVLFSSPLQLYEPEGAAAAEALDPEAQEIARIPFVPLTSE